MPNVNVSSFADSTNRVVLLKSKKELAKFVISNLIIFVLVQSFTYGLSINIVNAFHCNNLYECYNSYLEDSTNYCYVKDSQFYKEFSSEEKYFSK